MGRLLSSCTGSPTTHTRMTMWYRCWSSARPPISVPTVALYGGDNGVSPASSSERNRHLFTGDFDSRVLPEVGHSVPQEAPREFAVFRAFQGLRLVVCENDAS